MALGLGGLVQKATSFRSIVKKGLQAWYKSDTTQAPLGEEEIANGNFSLGPELLANGDYSNGESDWDVFGTGWDVVDGKAKFTGSSAANIQQNSVLVASSTYQVTLTVSGMSVGSLSVRLGTAESDEVLSITSNGTYTAYGAAGGVNFKLRAQDPGSGFFNGSIDNVSVRQTNPNNSWSSVVASGSTLTFKDSAVDLVTDGANINIQQTILIVGKRYKAVIDFTTNSGSGVDIKDGAGLSIGSISSSGLHSFEFTATNAIFLIVRNGSSAGSYTINSVSVKEITNSVRDYSSNHNNAVLYSGTCLSFDGSNDKIDFGNPGYSMKTVAFWINVADVTSNTEQLMEFQTSNGLSSVDGTITTAGTWTGKVTYVDGVVADSLTAGNWHRVVLTTTAAITVNDFVVGYDDSNYGDFDIADLQIYDSVWSASDVTYDYNNPDKDVFDNSDTSILSVNCKALYRLNEGGGTRVYNAAPVLGAELITDQSLSAYNTASSGGDFTTGSDGIDVNTSGTNYIAMTGVSVPAGSVSRISITVSNYVSGRMGMYMDGTDNRVIADGNGTFTGVDINPSGSTGTIYLQPPGGSGGSVSATGFIGTIESISVKQISLSDSYAITGASYITAQPYIPQHTMSSYSKKINFTGIDEKVDLGSTQTIADNEAASISFWYAIGANSSDENYILGTNTGDDYLRIDNQSESLLWRMNGSGVTFDFPDLSENKLSHICITRASGNQPDAKCYVNGVLASSYTNSDNPNGSDGIFNYRYIGSFGSTTSMTGFLDELAIFGKELSQAEVQEIFNSGLALDVRDHSAYLGSELVTWDGSTTGDWSLAYANTTLSANSGRLRATANASGAYGASQSFTTVVGKVYKVDFNINVDNASGGTGNLRVSNSASLGSPIATLSTSTGVGTGYFTATATTTHVGLVDTAADDTNYIEIESISVKEVQAAGYWRNNGADTWDDLSSYGNDGTVTTHADTVIVKLQEVPHFNKDSLGLPMNRVRQKGLNLDGDSYVKVDDDSSLGDMDDGFTCAFWYRHFEDVGTSNYSYLVAKGTGLGKHIDAGFCASVYDNKMYADLNTNTTPNGRFTINYSIGAASSSSPVWYYITATYNGSDELELYVDATSRGTAAVTGSVTATAEAYPITIGTDKNYYSKEARSVVDEVKWYNRALTQAEINRNYKASKSKHSSTSNWSDDFGDSFV
jgi:hypothetical protein